MGASEETKKENVLNCICKHIRGSGTFVYTYLNIPQYFVFEQRMYCVSDLSCPLPVIGRLELMWASSANHRSRQLRSLRQSVVSTYVPASLKQQTLWSMTCWWQRSVKEAQPPITVWQPGNPTNAIKFKCACVTWKTLASYLENKAWGQNPVMNATDVNLVPVMVM